MNLTNKTKFAAKLGKPVHQLQDALNDALYKKQYERLNEFGIRAQAHSGMIVIAYNGSTYSVLNSYENIYKVLLTIVK